MNEAEETDSVVIAPSQSGGHTSVRNSMAIRASLKPLLNSERIAEAETFMKNLSTTQENSTRRVNKRKSFSKRVTQSFKVNLQEVQESVNRLTRDENLPSNRIYRPSHKKGKGMKKDETHSVVGWTEISEEQDFANSDFEAMIGGSGTNSKQLLSPYHKTQAPLKGVVAGGDKNS